MLIWRRALPSLMIQMIGEWASLWNLNQVHIADRAFAGFVFYYLRIHRAGIIYIVSYFIFFSSAGNKERNQ